MLSDLHYKLIMNEKPQKKGRTHTPAGNERVPVRLTLGAGGPVWGTWVDVTFPATAPKDGVCAEQWGC